MITRKLKIAFVFAASWASVSAGAFELITHGVITNRAYAASALGGQPDAFKRLGLLDLAAPFGASYYDFTSFSVSKRLANPYEESKMFDALRDQLRVVGWLMRGAIREDDGGFFAAVRAREPIFTDPDPSGLINRFCNHFLDPITRNPLSSTFSESPLTFVGCPNAANISAPDWAMGTVAGGGDAFSSSPQAVDNFRNHFTIFLARETMWRALTMKDKTGSPAARVVGDTDEQMRKAYWATTFRALGDVLHLNQDMAQPQHTRNEAHGVGHASVFEHYADARAARAREFVFDSEGKLTAASEQLPELPLTVAYPVPRFDRYSDYWSTTAGDASISAGRGMADYASRGFFTPGKNLGNSYTGFPSPTNSEVAYSVTTDAPQSAGDCTGFAGRVKYAKGAQPPDFIAASPGTTRYASRSLLATMWTLNRCVFDDRIDLLIPRAVAYSAGLIDYFFRGQLEIRLPNDGVYGILDHSVAADNCKDNCGFRKIKLKVANSTPDITPSGGGTVAPQTMAGGTLVAVAKYHRNTCYTPDLEGEYDSSTLINGATETDVAYVQRCRSAAEEITVSQPLSNQNVTSCSATVEPADANSCNKKFDTITSLTFNFDTPIPINATDLYLQVVYRGPLGSEQDAVVVATKDIPEPTYFSVVNVTDYAVCYNNVWYYKTSSGALPPEIPPNIDPLSPKVAALVYKAANYDYWRVTFQPNEGAGPDASIARVNNLQPKEFARIAILIDSGRTYNDEIFNYRSPDLLPPFTLFKTGLNQISTEADGNARVNLLDFKRSSFRKVKATVPLFGYLINPSDNLGACRLLPTPPEPAYPPYTKPTVMKPVTITFN